MSVHRFLMRSLAAMLILAPSLASGDPVWMDETTVSQGLARSESPALAWDAAGVIHTVWSGRAGGHPEIYHARDEGTGWTAPEPLTADPAGSWDPAIVTDAAGHLHVVWSEERDGEAEIYHKQWDGGLWTDDERLTIALGRSESPSIAADPSGDVHIAWTDERNGVRQIYHKVWDGASWSADEAVSDGASPGWAPSIAAGPAGTVEIVWVARIAGRHEIRTRRWNGVEWSPESTLSAANPGAAPSIALSPDGDLHVVWVEIQYDPAFDRLYLRYRRRTGSDWTPSYRLTALPRYCAAPAIATGDDGRIDLVWEDAREGNEEIFYRSQEGGAWAPDDERLTDATGASSAPAIARDPGGRVCVAWCDHRSGSAEIMARLGRPVAAVETPPAQDLSRTITLSPNPFRDRVAFRISGPAGPIRLRIFEPSGRTVWTATSNGDDAAAKPLEWDARDDAGRSVGPGVFLYQVSRGDRLVSGSVVHIR